MRELASKFECATIVTYTTIVFKCGPNVFHSMFGDGRCCPSDSRHQELFVVPRVCGCISYSRHMALRKNSIIYYFTFGKESSSAQGPPMPWGCSVRSRNGYRYICTFNSCLWCQGFTHASDPGEEPHQFLCGKAVEMYSNQRKQCK